MKFYCDQCDYSVGNRTTFKDHKRIKHEGKLYKCTQCEYTGSSALNLKRHVEGKHLGVRHTCDVCGQVFMRNSTLERHLGNVHDIHNPTRIIRAKVKKEKDENIKCTECEYVGTNARMLKFHIAGQHQGIRYPCDQCDKVFMRKNTLWNHKRKVHESKEPAD